MAVNSSEWQKVERKSKHSNQSGNATNQNRLTAPQATKGRNHDSKATSSKPKSSSSLLEEMSVEAIEMLVDESMRLYTRSDEYMCLVEIALYINSHRPVSSSARDWDLPEDVEEYLYDFYDGQTDDFLVSGCIYAVKNFVDDVSKSNALSRQACRQPSQMLRQYSPFFEYLRRYCESRKRTAVLHQLLNRADELLTIGQSKNFQHIAKEYRSASEIVVSRLVALLFSGQDFDLAIKLWRSYMEPAILASREPAQLKADATSFIRSSAKSWSSRGNVIYSSQLLEIFKGFTLAWSDNVWDRSDVQPLMLNLTKMCISNSTGCVDLLPDFLIYLETISTSHPFADVLSELICYCLVEASANVRRTSAIQWTRIMKECPPATIAVIRELDSRYASRLRSDSIGRCDLLDALKSSSRLISMPPELEQSIQSLTSHLESCRTRSESSRPSSILWQAVSLPIRALASVLLSPHLWIAVAMVFVMLAVEYCRKHDHQITDIMNIHSKSYEEVLAVSRAKIHDTAHWISMEAHSAWTKLVRELTRHWHIELLPLFRRFQRHMLEAIEAVLRSIDHYLH